MPCRILWILVVCAPALASGACSFHRVPLHVEPVDDEGRFVRACELLASACEQQQCRRDPPSLRGQQATMSALAAIRPPGRFCFVCRRMRRCAVRLGELGRDPDLTARQLVLLAAARWPPLPGGERELPGGLPPPGGPELSDVLDEVCRSCAAMPERIQDGTW